MIEVREIPPSAPERLSVRRFAIETEGAKLVVAVQGFLDVEAMPDADPIWEPRPGAGLNQSLAHELSLLVATLLASPMATKLESGKPPKS
jgi:hypothetical protein